MSDKHQKPQPFVIETIGKMFVHDAGEGTETRFEFDIVENKPVTFPLTKVTVVHCVGTEDDDRMVYVDIQQPGTQDSIGGAFQLPNGIVRTVCGQSEDSFEAVWFDHFALKYTKTNVSIGAIKLLGFENEWFFARDAFKRH